MRLVLAVLALLGGLAATTGVAHACSCIAPGDPQADVARADAAVFGRVTAVRPRGDFRVVVHLRVLSDYKGNVARRIRLHTNNQSSACGLSVRRGQRIGLLLARADGRWTAGLCGVRERRFLERGAGAGGAAAAGASAACG